MQHLRAHVAQLAQLVVGYALYRVGIVNYARIGHEYAGNIRPVFVNVGVQRRRCQRAGHVAAAAREHADAAVGHCAVKAGGDYPAAGGKALKLLVGALLVDGAVEGKMQPKLRVEEVVAEEIGHELCREIFAARYELILGYAGLDLLAQRGKLGVDIDRKPKLGADLAIAVGDHVEHGIAADAVLFVRMAQIQKIRKLVIILKAFSCRGNDDDLARRIRLDDGLDFSELPGVRH